MKDEVHTKYFLSLESEASEQYIILTLIEAAMIRLAINQFISHMILLSFYRVFVCLQQIRYFPEELERCVCCNGQLSDLQLEESNGRRFQTKVTGGSAIEKR